MAGYNCCHVWHAAVAHLDIEFAANFVQSMMGRKVFSEQSQEFLADVGFDMLAKRWVKPRDASFPLFLFLGAKDICILQFTSVSTSMHDLFVLRDIFGKFLATQELQEASSEHLWELFLITGRWLDGRCT